MGGAIEQDANLRVALHERFGINWGAQFILHGLGGSAELKLADCFSVGVLDFLPVAGVDLLAVDIDTTSTKCSEQD